MTPKHPDLSPSSISPFGRSIGKSLLLGATLAASLYACATEPGFLQNDSDSADRAEELSLRYVRADTNLLNGVDDVQAKRVFIDKHGRPHTTLQQTVAGIPVFGAEAIVHLKKDGGLRSVTDGLVRGLRVDTSSTLSEAKAAEIAVKKHGGWSTVTNTPAVDKQIVVVKDSAVLTYRVAFDQLADMAHAAQPVVFIDAKTGDLVMEYDDLKHTALSDGEKITYNVGNSTNTKKPLPVADSSDSVANDAHTNAGLALAYYDSVQGRNSFDDQGSIIKSYVHYGVNYVNAYWDGAVLTYGDGDGVQSDPLTTLDIVSHELSHGVCTYTANLAYQNESGALNEANSDIMAAAIEAAQPGASFDDIWLIGEDAWTPAIAGDALRYMCDPAAGGDVDYYFDRYTGTADNGGVHSNSGIANLFFCLVSNGGTHPRNKSSIAVQGVTIEKAADMWYQALSSYMTSSTTFEQARAATLAAAADEGFSASEIQSVEDAWAAVGVGIPTPPPLEYSSIHAESIDGAQGSTATYGPYSSAGYKEMLIAIAGGSGDADLYVKKGSAPSTTDYDCRPYLAGNNESCKFVTDPLVAESFYVMVAGFKAYSSVNLTVEGGNEPGPECYVDGDCNDADACTTDSCDNGSCVAAPVGYDSASDTCCTADAECGSSDVCTTYTCNADGSCSSTDTGLCCTTDSECNDGDTCTDDVCNAGMCSYPDNNSCQVDACFPSKTECSDNAECCSNNCRTKGKFAGTCS